MAKSAGDRGRLEILVYFIILSLVTALLIGGPLMEIQL